MRYLGRVSLILFISFVLIIWILRLQMTSFFRRRKKAAMPSPGWEYDAKLMMLIHNGRKPHVSSHLFSC